MSMDVLRREAEGLAAAMELAPVFTKCQDGWNSVYIGDPHYKHGAALDADEMKTLKQNLQRLWEETDTRANLNALADQYPDEKGYPYYSPYLYNIEANFLRCCKNATRYEMVQSCRGAMFEEAFHELRDALLDGDLEAASKSMKKYVFVMSGDNSHKMMMNPHYITTAQHS